MATAAGCSSGDVLEGTSQSGDATGASAAPGGNPNSGGDGSQKPVCLIVLGMAGSGKTTFVQVANNSYHKDTHKVTLANVSQLVSDPTISRFVLFTVY